MDAKQLRKQLWIHPGDIEILGWGEAASSLSDAVTIKMPHEVDVLHRPVVHPIFSYWVG